MNGNFDGLDGMYGKLQLEALSELNHLFGAGKRTGLPWKRIALLFAAITVPVVLLAGGLGA